jgi:hypothetical protein
MSPKLSVKSVTLKKSVLRGSAPIFAALGDETRLRLIAVLCAGGAMSIAQLTSGTDITRQRLWEFEPTQLEEARRTLEMITQQWDHALMKLKLAVER